MILNNKQKSHLKSMANKLRALFQVGKDGCTPNLIKTVDNALEAHELVKISCLKSCDADVREIAFDISSATNSNIVQIIGRTFILYRKSKDSKIILP